MRSDKCSILNSQFLSEGTDSFHSRCPISSDRNQALRIEHWSDLLFVLSSTVDFEKSAL
jgi:hypothetical protein